MREDEETEGKGDYEEEGKCLSSIELIWPWEGGEGEGGKRTGRKGWRKTRMNVVKREKEESNVVI